MTLAYIPRLLCLAVTCFVFVYGVSAAAVAVWAPLGIRFANRRPASQAAGLVLALRLLPLGLAAAITAGLCVPSYVWFEPVRTEEPVSLGLVAAALLSFLSGGIVIVRAGRSVAKSLVFARRCWRSGRETLLCGEREEAVLLDTFEPFLALSGFVRPRVVISNGIVSALSNEELSLVLSHENAHRCAFDNLKRLCIFLSPGSKRLEQSWRHLSEYAADDRAAGGDPGRSLVLASALIKVARMGRCRPLMLAETPFLADPSDLSARVNRLLTGPPAGATRSRLVWYALGATSLLAPLIFRPPTFRLVHSILERII